MTLLLRRPIQVFSDRIYIELANESLFEVLIQEQPITLPSDSTKYYPYKHVQSGIIVTPGEESKCAKIGASALLTKVAALAAGKGDFSHLVVVEKISKPPELPSLKDEFEEARKNFDMKTKSPTILQSTNNQESESEESEENETEPVTEKVTPPPPENKNIPVENKEEKKAGFMRAMLKDAVNFHNIDSTLHSGPGVSEEKEVLLPSNVKMDPKTFRIEKRLDADIVGAKTQGEIQSAMEKRSQKEKSLEQELKEFGLPAQMIKSVIAEKTSQPQIPAKEFSTDEILKMGKPFVAASAAPATPKLTPKTKPSELLQLRRLINAQMTSLAALSQMVDEIMLSKYQ